MMPRPGDDPIGLALRLCELPEPRIAGQYLEEFPVAAKWLMAAGALREGDLVQGLTVDDDFEGPPCEVVWRPETRSYAYFSPTGCWVEVPLQYVRYYILDLVWLLRTLGGAVGISAQIAPRSLVDGLLWALGDTWLGRRKAMILFGRRMSDVANLDAVHDALGQQIGRPSGILLTSSRGLSRHLSLPGGHRILALHDCLLRASAGLMLDLDMLHGALVGALSGHRGPMQMSGDGGLVRIHDREFVFTGEIQRAIVRRLGEAWRSGEPKVRTQALLEDVGSRARQLSHIFRGHLNWRELIRYGQGYCWLEIG